MDEVQTDSTEQTTAVVPEPTVAPVVETKAPTVASEVTEKPTISDEGKARMEAEANYLKDHPDRKEYMRKLLAEQDSDPVAELEKKFELKYARQEAVINHPELKDHMDILAGDTPDEIKANAAKLAAAIKPAQGQSTEVETTTTPQVGTEPAPVEAPAQAGTPLPVLPSTVTDSLRGKSMTEILKEVTAQKAAGVDVDGQCESAR